MRQLGLDDICIHQVCLSGQTDFAGSLAALSRAGISLTAVWAPMLEETGLPQARKLMAAAGIRAVSLCAGQIFAGREACLSMLDQAGELGAETLVLITGGYDPAITNLDEARQRAFDDLAELAEISRHMPVRLALEPLHPMVCGLRSVICSLAEANEALDQLDKMVPDHRVGLAVDSYALWWETSVFDQIARAGDRILNYHISDWLAETRDVRLDRGMPGSGLIDLCGWRRAVEQTGFDGPVEIEIFSAPDWWKRPPDDMVAAILAGMNKFY